MFEGIMKVFRRIGKKEQEEISSKDTAKERLHLVLMQDRANVSADFLEMMKQEIIDVIKKYIDVDDNDIDVRLTNKTNDDGTTGAPALYANIPITGIKQVNENKEDESKKEKINKKEPSTLENNKNNTKNQNEAEMKNGKDSIKNTGNKSETQKSNNIDNKKETNNTAKTKKSNMQKNTNKKVNNKNLGNNETKTTKDKNNTKQASEVQADESEKKETVSFTEEN